MPGQREQRTEGKDTHNDEDWQDEVCQAVVEAGVGLFGFVLDLALIIYFLFFFLSYSPMGGVQI